MNHENKPDTTDENRYSAATCNVIPLPAVCGRCREIPADAILILEALEANDGFAEFCQTVLGDAPNESASIGRNTGLVLVLCTTCMKQLIQTVRPERN